MPPGETIVLRLACGDGLFGWWRPHPSSGIVAMNKLDGWTCTIFRNCSPILSSELIYDAEIALALADVTVGPSGLITYVWDKRVETGKQSGRAAVGWCFRKAGWRVTGRSADGKKSLMQKAWQS